MKIMKIFTARELQLDQEEERYLCERCGGSADSCYEKMTVLSHKDTLEEYDNDDILNSVMAKLRATDKIEIGETVMIDLCW